jgi:urease accessory protein
MRRVVRVLGAGASAAQPIDSVMLNADQRRVQAARLTGINGTEIGIMLPEAVTVRMGDLFELDGGDVVEVVVAPEALTEVRGNDLTHLARLAWHLGDRHVPVQIMSNRLRMRRDAALETMLGALGARLTPIEAPFDPEGGAYTAQVAHAHDHHHGHDHHDHHHHVYDEHCGHDHSHDHHHGHGHHHHGPGHKG